MAMAGISSTDIRFDQVSFTYVDGSDSVQALKDVSFVVEPGESVALIGPSGCGKSTLLHLVAGLVQPDEGQVLVGGKRLDKPRRETSFIPQDLGLFPWKTVLQNAALGLRLRGVRKAEANGRAQDALREVGLEGFEHVYPKSLSGGMRQRLALARALAMDADVLLMDEPLSAIDALLRETLQDALLDLHRKRGHTQLLVTHSIEEAVYLGNRILVFSERPGTVVADIENPLMGTPDYRYSEPFSVLCRVVRTALAADTEAGEGVA